MRTFTIFAAIGVIAIAGDVVGIAAGCGWGGSGGLGWGNGRCFDAVIHIRRRSGGRFCRAVVFLRRCTAGQ